MYYVNGGADIPAGTVVVLGAGITNGISRALIPSGATGALDIGGGRYIVAAAAAYAVWTKVYWDNAAKNVTTVSAGNSLFGYLLEASSGAAALVECRHFPYA